MARRSAIGPKNQSTKTDVIRRAQAEIRSNRQFGFGTFHAVIGRSQRHHKRRVKYMETYSGCSVATLSTIKRRTHCLTSLRRKCTSSVNFNPTTSTIQRERYGASRLRNS